MAIGPFSTKKKKKAILSLSKKNNIQSVSLN